VDKNRNITFNLPSELIRQAKIYAAEHDSTVNALVRELLEGKVSSEARARAAAKRILEIARRGPHSTVDPGSISRDEIHERR
jgi:plasmid stability protein